MKLQPHQQIEQLGQLLNRLSHGQYVVGIYPLSTNGSVCVSGGQFDGWGGEVEVVVRLRDLKITPGKMQEALPVLNNSTELCQLVVTAVLWAKRNWFEHFITQLDASVYRTVAKEYCQQRYKMALHKPGVEDRTWRLSIIVHCSEIAAMLNEVFLEIAKEGEM